jgi:diguanylate cyclase (GGDEF)-like protein
MKQEKTVSEKVIHLLVWIIAFAFTLISLGTAFMVYRLSLNGRMASLRAAANVLAADIDGWFEREMANCAQTSEIVNNLYDIHKAATLTSAERARIYVALINKNKQYLNVYDASGQEFVSGNSAKLPANFNPARRAWYIEAIKTPGKTVVIPPYVDAVTGMICMTFAQTIAPNDDKRGVFGIDIALNQIRAYVNEANADPKAHFFIADDRGRILVHPDSVLMPDKHGSFTTVMPHLWQQIKDSETSVLNFDVYGNLAYYISSPLHSTGWRIVSTVRLWEIVAPITAVIVLILASFSLIIACIVILLRHRLNILVSAPLDSLRRIVDEIAAGNDHVLIEPDRYHAEFRLFAESFKQMCALRYTASHDGLSGLLNRSAFFSAAEHDYALMRRQGTPGCAMMMDIDLFKQINDTHGHSTGDQVIVGVAGVLRERLRGTDIAGRYGGDEFCVWLPDTNREGATVLAEALRKGVAALLFYNEIGAPLGVTISIGLADSAAANIGALLEQADKAMYHAKHSGRNRVEVYTVEREKRREKDQEQGVDRKE